MELIDAHVLKTHIHRVAQKSTSLFSHRYNYKVELDNGLELFYGSVEEPELFSEGDRVVSVGTTENTEFYASVVYNQSKKLLDTLESSFWSVFWMLPFMLGLFVFITLPAVYLFVKGYTEPGATAWLVISLICIVWFGFQVISYLRRRRGIQLIYARVNEQMSIVEE